MNKVRQIFAGAVGLVLTGAPVALAHETGTDHAEPAVDIIASAGPNDVPLWGDILMMAVLAAIIIGGLFLVYYFHMLKHRKETKS